MTEELKPCPWCEREVYIDTHAVIDNGRTVCSGYAIEHRCKLLGKVHSRPFVFKQDAIAAWNRRGE